MFALLLFSFSLPSITFSLGRAVDFATIAAAFAAAAGLFFTGYQLRHSRSELEHSRSVATADALLSLDGLLERFDAIHLKIHKRENLKRDEWYEVAWYMGLLERIKVMIDKGLVDIDTIDRLYGFRIKTIMENPRISRWLKNEGRNWQDLIQLNERLSEHRAQKPSH